MNKELKINGIYGSGMVLQRNKINCVYGTAGVFSDVMMTFRGVTSITQADESGNWKLEFSPGEAGGPFVMTIKSDSQKIDFTDVFVGEVWLCSGQSNMQLPMERMKYSYPAEFVQPKNENIRMLTVPISWSFDGEKDSLPQTEWISNADEGTKAECVNPGADNLTGVKWICASPETLGEMSGTGYFFAKKIMEELDVPVGIINASQGGSPIASWLSKTALEELGGKTEYLEKIKYFENSDNVKKEQEALAAKQAEWNKKLLDGVQYPDTATDSLWKECTIPGDIDGTEKAGIVWFKKEIELTEEQISHFKKYSANLWLGTIIDADVAYINGEKVGETPYCYPPRRYKFSADLLHAGKNIIVLRVQKNSKIGKIRFFTEKPYCLFTDNVIISPVATRNIEQRHDTLFPLDGEEISLEGTWKMKIEKQIEDCPENLFFEWLPTALYNSMLAPCFKYAISGVLWYQGESDAGNANDYKGMLVKLIELWRHKFVYGAKDLPFVVVQLPNWSNGTNEDSTSVDGGWANIRQVQAEAAEIAGRTGLAVTIDAGEWNDLHPEKKLTVGTRAALEALRVAYGKTYISPAPKAVFCENDEDKYTIHFDCGNSSLAAFKIEDNIADFYIEDTEVFGFSFLCKKDNEFIAVAAKAKLIEDEIVEVYVPKDCGTPLELRYLWADSPSPINLYSRDLIPVVPFRLKA